MPTVLPRALPHPWPLFAHMQPNRLKLNPLVNDDGSPPGAIRVAITMPSVSLSNDLPLSSLSRSSTLHSLPSNPPPFRNVPVPRRLHTSTWRNRYTQQPSPCPPPPPITRATPPLPRDPARHAYTAHTPLPCPASVLDVQQRHLLDERPQLPARRGVARQQAVQPGPQVALGGQHVARAALQPLHVLHGLGGRGGMAKGQGKACVKGVLGN